jgi:hypothetical protein
MLSLNSKPAGVRHSYIDQAAAQLTMTEVSH